MRETSNYKLSQWDKTDRIQMEDFNDNFLKIDAALQENREKSTVRQIKIATVFFIKQKASKLKRIKIGSTSKPTEKRQADTVDGTLFNLRA